MVLDRMIGVLAGGFRDNPWHDGPQGFEFNPNVADYQRMSVRTKTQPPI